MLLSCFSNCVEGVKGKLDDSMKTIRRSLEFLGPHIDATSEDPLAEEAQHLSTG